MAEFPGKGKVAVLKTTPDTVLEDYQRLMELARFQDALPKNVRTGIKINISWQTWYPACSSAPWQLEGVIRALQGAGYRDLVGVHNDTVVVDTRVGGVQQQAPLRHRQVRRPLLVLVRAGLRVVRVPAQAAVPRPRQGLPRGGVHPQGDCRHEHGPPADGQDPRLYHHHS